MGSWKKRIIKQLINFAFLSIKLSFLELCLLNLTAKFPAQPPPCYGSQVVCTAERNVCCASLLCCWCLPLSSLKSQTTLNQRSPFKAFAKDVMRNKHPLSVRLRARSQFANQQLLLFLWWFLQIQDRSEHSLGLRWSVWFTFYFPFWKWGLSLCPVVLLSPWVAMVLPFPLWTLCCFHKPCEISGMGLSPWNL